MSNAAPRALPLDGSGHGGFVLHEARRALYDVGAARNEMHRDDDRYARPTRGRDIGRPHRRSPRVLAALLALAATLRAGGAAATSTATADELALLALTNEARADAGLTPLVWHDGLGTAAHQHSSDMATNGCFQHDSCNGQNWATRIGRYYPWLALGENIAMGLNDPRSLHEGWMASSGHRANILGRFSEFGAGIVLGQTSFGLLALATEDFGDRGAISAAAIPTLPAGGVSPRLGLDPTRELFVNYYRSTGGAPEAVRALIGGACVDLPRTAGTATNGTYGIDYTFPTSGCIPVVFEAIRADGVRIRWPEGAALLVGIGRDGLACADTTTDVPTQDCGGSNLPQDPPPTPVPTPVATPGTADDAIHDLDVGLRPGRTGAGTATVTLKATLPSMTGFDPAAAPLEVTIAPAASLAWSTTIPAQCEGGPCLLGNARGTAFRGRVDSVSASFTRRADGSWKMRLTARRQTLGALRAGPIEVTVTVDGRTFTATTQGLLKSSGVLVD